MAGVSQIGENLKEIMAALDGTFTERERQW
jgi:hypothetical protein